VVSFGDADKKSVPKRNARRSLWIDASFASGRRCPLFAARFARAAEKLRYAGAAVDPGAN